MPISQGDMPRQLARRQPEIAEGLRIVAAVMIADQQERRAACGILFGYWRNICASKSNEVVAGAVQSHFSSTVAYRSSTPI